MLLKTSIDRKEKEIEIDQRSGQSFNLLIKLKHQLFGSPRYRIINMFPDVIGFEKNNDLIYCNIELRNKGVVLYFRFKQDEFAICGRYNQTVFQSSNNIFEIQIGNDRVKTEIINPKSHQKFISKFLKLKNENMYR
tara:strand:+ start:348 stop:755 length:408 start_codon:yes stop_codon:yes gene_type:complete